MGTVATNNDQEQQQMTVYYVIPCGAEKQQAAAPAKDLYTGSMFRHTLAAALAQGDGKVLILSAKHGLLELDTVVEPYEQRMGKRGCVSAATLVAQAQALGIDWDSEVTCMLPNDYLLALDKALRTVDVYVQPLYEVARGIGDQKQINVLCQRHAAAD